MDAMDTKESQLRDVVAPTRVSVEVRQNYEAARRWGVCIRARAGSGLGSVRDAIER
jgi:hypothetical protein